MHRPQPPQPAHTPRGTRNNQNKSYTLELINRLGGGPLLSRNQSEGFLSPT